MRALLALMLLLAGCAGPVDDAGPGGPIYDGPTAEELDEAKKAEREAAKLQALRERPRHDPWGEATEVVLAEGAIDWHQQSSTPFNDVYDRVVMIALPVCTFQGEPYFYNPYLDTVDVWNFTERVEVTLEWDLVSYTRDALRLSYRAGADATYEDSPSGRNGQPIALPTDWQSWSEAPGRSIERGWVFAACSDEDIGDVPPGYFEGELRYQIKAFKMTDLGSWNVA